MPKTARKVTKKKATAQKKPTRVSAFPPAKSRKMLFVGGLPRAGSTLLMNLLGQNPRFGVTPTSGLSHLLWSLRAAFTNAQEFQAQGEAEMNRRFRNCARGVITGWAEGDQPVYIDKSRWWLQNFETLREVLGAPPKIVVPVRDLRGICASMEKLFRANSLRIDPTQRGQNLQGLTVTGRVQLWCASNPIGAAAQRVRDTINRDVAGQLLFVRMEDLCTNPEEQLRQVYDYIGEKWQPHSYEKIEQLTVEDDRVFGIPNLHKVWPKIEPVAEDWDAVLGKELSSEIRRENSWFYELFYRERM